VGCEGQWIGSPPLFDWVILTLKEFHPQFDQIPKKSLKIRFVKIFGDAAHYLLGKSEENLKKCK
jgi:hypothetical protein